MNVTMNVRHFHLSAGLKEYLMNKSDGLKKYFSSDELKIAWSFHKENENVSVHAHLTSGSCNFFADAITDEAKEAIERVTERLRTQIKKERQKERDRYQKGSH